MRTRKNSIWILMLGMMFLLANCSTLNIGQKPILTMEDVKSLSPADLADFAISLYNKQADWYRDRIDRWSYLTPNQQKQAVSDFKLLCNSWDVIDLYDRLVTVGQPSEDTRIEIYRFIERYLGGGN